MLSTAAAVLNGAFLALMGIALVQWFADDREGRRVRLYAYLFLALNTWIAVAVAYQQPDPVRWFDWVLLACSPFVLFGLISSDNLRNAVPGVDWRFVAAIVSVVMAQILANVARTLLAA